jgi:hypothetical protein
LGKSSNEHEMKIPSIIPPEYFYFSFVSGTQPGEYRDLSGATTSMYSNGTIRFEEIRKSDEGSYLCEARNDVEPNLSKIFLIKVNGKRQKGK